MSGGGYDISQSTSESATQGLSNSFGPFQVGGGVRIPEYLWPVLVAGLVVIAIFFFKRK